MLDTRASASLRDQLLAEVEGLRSADAMIAWAQDSLPLKNTLVAPDADAVEKAFRVKAEKLDVHRHQEKSCDEAAPAPRANDQRSAALQPDREAIAAEGGDMAGAASATEPVPEAVPQTARDSHDAGDPAKAAAPARHSAHAVPCGGRWYREHGGSATSVISNS
jgi:hypothetical protein